MEAKICSQRQSNFELLRIISMMMIVTLHFMGHGKVLDSVQFGSFNFLLAWFVEILSAVAVNCYVLLSGYFLVKSKFEIRKLILIWLQVEFYSLFIYIIFILMGFETFQLKHLMAALLPVTTNQYWFFSCYFGVYLFSPIINRVVESLDPKLYRQIIVTGILFFVIIPSGQKDPFLVNHGYSVFWFIFLYFIAAYIRLYGLKGQKKFLCYVSFAVFAVLIKIITVKINIASNIGLVDYNFITTFLASVSLFAYFKDVRINVDKINRIILFFSPLTFGVYLIHDNQYMREILWKIIVPAKYVNSVALWECFVITILTIYISCSLIDYFRQKIFLILRMSVFAYWLAEKIKSVALKI